MRLSDMINPYNCSPSGIIAAYEDVFNGDPSTDIVGLSRYEEVVFLIVKAAGATGTATITVEACDDVTPSNNTAIAFRYKVCTSGNTWGAWTAATTAGFATTAGANQAYMIAVKAEDLTAGYEYVRLVATEVVDSPCDGAILCILMSPRYSQDVQKEAIT